MFLKQGQWKMHGLRLIVDQDLVSNKLPKSQGN